MEIMASQIGQDGVKAITDFGESTRILNNQFAVGIARIQAFTASNTIQGQLTRLGTAFTNLTTEGSEFGVIIRETLKVAAVTVEALGAAFKIVLAPVRAVVAAVGEIGS